jgi:F0F1-type ATP synthase epsilon subunit
MDTEQLFLIIRNREQVLFEGEIKALSSLSDKGIFDILPEHENFISVIKERLTIHKLDGTNTEMELTYGIVKVYMNKVWVYLGILPEKTS